MASPAALPSPIDLGFPWGKFSHPDGGRHFVGDGRDQFLPLYRHMLDVAACFLEIVHQPVFRARLEGAAKEKLSEGQLERLAVLVALHDLGKINTGFQFKIFPNSLSNGHIGPGWHMLVKSELGFNSALNLAELENWSKGLKSLFWAILNHHGKPTLNSTTGALNNDRLEHYTPFQGYHPQQALTNLWLQIKESFPLAFSELTQPLPNVAELQHYLCGMTSLADQVGSREIDFPVSRPELSAPEALRDSRLRAKKSLKKIGLNVQQLRERKQTDLPAAQLFGWADKTSPSQMQEATAHCSNHLIILESETGSGKTEAAFLRFQELFEKGEVDSLYFAVPTRAAASALQERLNKASLAFLGTETILAVPGYLKAGTAVGIRLAGFEVSWPDKSQDKEMRWAAETPRFYLAAPLAVGTVDQALLAALSTKWAHLRASALSRALLVIDEVHASDAYMTQIGASLVQDHIKRGGHALLMSATLGAEARRKWLGLRPSWEDGEQGILERACAVPYPCLTMLDNQGCEHHQAMPSRQKPKTVSLSINTHINDPMRIAAFAAAQARDGLRVLVIRNTVKQALTVFDAFEKLAGADNAHPVPTLELNGVRTLHHSRFAVDDRKALDQAVNALFGKTATTEGAVLIGTQTLEQSLDIDADLLITDLCPIDVLLQRIGRLHRHERERPKNGRQARCIVLTPAALGKKTFQPDKGSLLIYGMGPPRGNSTNGGVYPDLRMLEQTRRLINKCPLWTIPQDNRFLVEQGTNPDILIQLQKERARVVPQWNDHAAVVEGYQCTNKKEAGHLVLNRKAVMAAQLPFPSDEIVSTRLGLANLLIEFPSPPIGPFGNLLTRIMLPAYMAPAICPATNGKASDLSNLSEKDLTPEILSPLPKILEDDPRTSHAKKNPEEIVFRLGQAVFYYSRCGLASEKSFSDEIPPDDET
ncbi:CRISPR-associated helicase Cas3' [Oecophyllibacter saccharovorans]|uniref:CRISPR-associated helicase Cas3 n=1 Tax=Oecophyllibacter saccharovorans TaxID=2558360 RepID=A0A506URL7_9PROT|nr:CRISPR-associated helicase Cas3' [Oecophyllibacter saccharovorans]TPW35997.1 CRISPR-associated helicase Cas3' [Oecophyllibacter saccharovorans]